MSAYIVSDDTINALVTYAVSKGLLPYFKYDAPQFNGREPTAQDIAQLLLDENARSVNARYNESEKPTIAYKECRILHNGAHTGELPLTILKLCSCYDYQACETDDYEETDAARIIRRIRGSAIGDLPGYDAAPWGL